VTFSAPASGASGTFAGGATSVNVLTDLQGIATAPPFTANASAGTYNVTASCGPISVAFALTNLAGAPASITPTAGATLSALHGAAFGTMQATVRDANNNPVPNITVNFAAPETGAGGTYPGGVLLASAVTNASGVAVSPTFTANNTLGSYSIFTGIVGAVFTAHFSLTNIAGPPASMAITAGNNQTKPVLTPFDPFQVTVSDAQGFPVANVEFCSTTAAIRQLRRGLQHGYRPNRKRRRRHINTHPSAPVRLRHLRDNRPRAKYKHLPVDFLHNGRRPPASVQAYQGSGQSRYRLISPKLRPSCSTPMATVVTAPRDVHCSVYRR
jgi:hypothetical protein